MPTVYRKPSGKSLPPNKPSEDSVRKWERHRQRLGRDPKTPRLRKK